MTFRTRFAPSPTGPLHLGHAYSALLAADLAARYAGAFLLRIEDIDRTRARAPWEAQIFDDLTWLGLSWPEPVMRQSHRLQSYQTTLQSLQRLGLLYPCYCSRRDIAEAAHAPQEGAAPKMGPDGVVYPGTCRDRPKPPISAVPPALRLDMGKAIRRIGPNRSALTFTEEGDGTARSVHVAPKELLDQVGDVVLARRDMGTSYHLSVVVDDAAQGISHVVRGRDLFDATKIHVVLQRVLDLPTPVYHHHRLIRDEAGKRLAKRDDARALSKYRAEGLTPQDIRRMVGLAD
ncbi:tRNA glutamyl-Q(34) synthetase GluQRS [Roseobacter weihaiensis]|uniref:tRNA glutamyl-Q(34) synthetase GluQRS n=1 Tax=Roseobacter weihaiensis TaxID=2763262 RepID=UPI001D09A264|nr:tRNA glutamyl-Q(34) synthetase GluQRS [Roseobacter sp. H9]